MIGNQLSVGILDDNGVALSTISAFIKSFFESKKLHAAIKTYKKGSLLLAESCNFDLLFCDIEMPEENGIAIAEKYSKAHENTAIIFVSNREDKVFSALKIHPFGFVRKEHFFSDINGILEHYLKNLELNKLQGSIIIKNGNAAVKLKIDEIVFIEARLHTQEVHLSDGNIATATENMKFFVDTLEKYGFIHCHKSFIVNYLFIREIKQNTITLTTGDIIYISKRRLTKIKNTFIDLNTSN